MLKKIIAMLLAVTLVLLTACGTPQYDLSAVFAAAETERAEWLADPDNAVLWEKLGLSGSVVSAGDPTAMTIGAQRWLLQPATVNGEAVTLCFCLNEQDRPIVFILWGSPAQKKAQMLNNPKHLILKAPHPSPLSAYRGFFGSRPFSQTNEFLVKNGLEPIDWQIENV